MGITKSGTQITVRFDTGDSEGDINSPFSYQSIADAIVNNGWVGLYGVNGNCIYFEHIWIYMEGSETAFVDNNRDVTFSGDTGDWRVESVKSEVAKHELTNCIIKNTSTSFRWEDYTTNVYSGCSFYGLSGFTHHGSHDNCFFKDVDDLYATNNNSYNNVFAYLNRGFRIQGSSNIDNLLIIDANDGIMVDGKYFAGTSEINYVQPINCTNDLVYRLVDSDVSVTVKNSVINFDNRALWAVEAGNCTITVSATKEIHSNILNSVNGTLKLYNKDGGLIHSEVLSSDNMTPQDIIYEKLLVENSDGTIVTDNVTTNEPFRITVDKAGYYTFDTGNTIFATMKQNDTRTGTLNNIEVSDKMKLIETIPYTYYQFVEIFDQFDRPLSDSDVNIELGSQIYTGTTDSDGQLVLENEQRISYKPDPGQIIIEQNNEDWETVSQIESGSVLSQSLSVKANPSTTDSSPISYDYKQTMRLTNRSGEPLSNCYINMNFGDQTYKGTTDSNGQLVWEYQQRIKQNYQDENILIEQYDDSWQTVRKIEPDDTVIKSIDVITQIDEPLKTKLDDYYDDLKTKLAYIENNKFEYKHNEYPKSIVKLRDKYPTLTYYGTENYNSNKLLPETTYYSVINERSGEVVINKSEYTKLSSALDHNYFYFDMSTLEVGQYYRFRIHMITEQGEYHIFDNEYIFKVKQEE